MADEKYFDIDVVANGASRKVGKYRFSETLGKGGYSWVKKGVDTETNAIVALKFIARVTDKWAVEQAKQVQTEIKALTQVKHTNVMRLFAYNLSAQYPLKTGKFVKTILLVLEYCPGGEIFDILYYTDRLSETAARTWFQQMIDGLDACHQMGIAHRDIKPQNILLDADFKVKITDFGLSKIIESDEDFLMRTTYVGTRGYQAPELINNKKYTKACDIFSLGVIFFIMHAGYPPFERAHKTDQWYSPLTKGDAKGFWRGHRGCKVPEVVRDLIVGMLCYKPRHRITIDKIKEHPWFSGKTYSVDAMKKKIVGKFQEAREKKSEDPKKQEDLKVSYERGLEIWIPKVNADNKPRGLTVYATKMEPVLALHKLYIVIDEAFKSANVAPIEFNYFIATFATPHPERKAKLHYQLQVSVYEDCEYNQTLVDFKPIKVDDFMKWRDIYRRVIDEILSWDILSCGTGRKSVIEKSKDLVIVHSEGTLDVKRDLSSDTDEKLAISTNEAFQKGNDL